MQRLVAAECVLAVQRGPAALPAAVPPPQRQLAAGESCAQPWLPIGGTSDGWLLGTSLTTATLVYTQQALLPTAVGTMGLGSAAVGAVGTPAPPAGMSFAGDIALDSTQVAAAAAAITCTAVIELAPSAAHASQAHLQGASTAPDLAQLDAEAVSLFPNCCKLPCSATAACSG